MREKLAYNFKVIACIFIYSMIGIGGWLQFGLVSVGSFSAAIVVYIINVTIGRRASVVAMLLLLLTMVVIGVFWQRGVLVSTIDYNEFVISTSTWIAHISLFIVVAYLFSHVVGNMMDNIQHLLRLTHQQKEEIEHLANHDKLTGLPSLRLADDRLDMAISIAQRSQSKSVLLYLDLDAFKAVNDSYGHAAGDTILTVVAQRFSREIRATDTCCRIGGDEFLIIIPDIKETSTIEPLCQRLISEVQKAVTYEGKQLSVGVSIGVAVFPDNAQDSKSLRISADKAMYQVKKSGKNNYRFFTSTLAPQVN